MSEDVLRVVALTVASLFVLWAAVACRRAPYPGLPGSDALIWAGLSGAFLLSLLKTRVALACCKVRRFLALHLQAKRVDRTSSATVSQIGFYGLTLGFAIIRFISLNEVDAWNVQAPWARTAVDLVATAGVSVVAIARLWQLRAFASQRAKVKA